MTEIEGNTFTKLVSDGFLRVPIGTRATWIIRSVFETAKPFFRATSTEKMSNILKQDFGYRPLGVEYSQSPERPDPIESFTASARTKTAVTELNSASARRLYRNMTRAIEVLEPIAEELTLQLANVIGSADVAERLRGALNNWSSLQLNYSRPVKVATGLIHEPHEDGHLMTFACATAPGLEAQIKNGNYVPISNRQNELLAMPGEIVWLLSGGLIEPLYHRVRADHEQQERLALLFFVDVHPALCEPWIRNEVNTGVDIGSRVLTNSTRFGVNAFTLE